MLMDDTARAPVGAPQKEQEPVATSYIEKVEKQPEIPPEVARVGVKPVSDQVVFKKEDKDAGLAPAKAEVPVASEPDGLVTLPLTEEEAKKSSRGSVADAIVWLAQFVLRQFKLRRKV